MAHFHLFFLREQTGFDDDLQDALAADFLQRADLAQHIVVHAGLQGADVDDHIQLIRAVLDGVLRLKHLGGGGVVAVRETDDGADLHLVTDIFLRLSDIAGRDADGCGAVMDGIIAECLDLFPGGGLREQGVINHGHDFISKHNNTSLV